MTQIIVNNVWSRISDLNNINVIDGLDKITSYFVEGYRYTRAFTTGYYDYKRNKFVQWDGKKHLLTKALVFPTGLLERVEKYLKNKEVAYLIEDKRENMILGEELPIKFYLPRPYQTQAVEKAIDKGRGIIRVGTGGGKSLIAGMIVAKYNIPTMIYVVGKDLLYQFYYEFKKILDIPIGIIGDGKCEIEKINICSIWTAITAFDLNIQVSLDDEDWSPEVISINSREKNRVKKVIENANLAIYDEAHFLATETIQSIFKASKKCRFLFGLSGSDWRDDGADLLLESVCGPRIYNMPASNLISQGFLVPPKIVFYEVPPVEEDLGQHYLSIYSKYIVKNDIRNNAIIDIANKLINKNRKVLILVRQISHGETLFNKLLDLGISTYFVNGEVDGETRQQVKENFENGNLKCLIASSVFDIGVDIPTLDALILAGGGKSTVRSLQRIGRVIRTAPNKKDAIVVDFIDNAKYLDKHSAARITTYETEPEFRIKFPPNFDSQSIKRSKKVNNLIKT